VIGAAVVDADEVAGDGAGADLTRGDGIPPSTEQPRSPYRRLIDGVLALLLMAGLAAVVAAVLAGWVGITIVVGNSMEPTIDSGDLVLTRPQSSYRVGDVVVFRIPDGQAGEGNRVIHRITGGTAVGYRTAGDNRDGVDLWTPAASDIVGAHRLTVPAAGTLLLLVRSPLLLGVVLALAAFKLSLAIQQRRQPPDVGAERQAVTSSG
jgi:signal peptidase